MKGGFKAFIGGLFGGGIITGALGKVSDYIYNKLGKGIYSFIFGSYEDISDTFSGGMFGSFQNKKRSRACRYISKSIEESVYVNGIASAMTYLSRLSMRAIGVFLLSSGFYTVLAQLMMYLLFESKTSIPYGILAVLLMLLGIPLLFSGRPLCNVVYESKIFGNMVRKIFGFNDRAVESEAVPTGRLNAAFIIGLPFGILSCVVNPLFIAVGIVGMVGAYIILLNPECGYNLMLFMLPFLVVLPRPTIILSGIIIYTFICYMIKLVMGTRYFKPDFLDALVICFMGVLLLGGIFSYGGANSLNVSSIFVSLMLGYFLTVGLVNSKEMLKRVVAISSASLFLVSAYGLYQNFSGDVSAEWIDTAMFDSISGRVVSTFENPNMLGEYLILLLPVIAAASFGDKGSFKRPGFFVTFAAGAACLIFTWARGAWLGFIFASALFMLIYSRKMMGVIIACLAALPFAVPYLPASIVSRFSSIGDLSDTSTNYRVYIWRGSVNLASDYALTGIGVGEQAFDRIYPYYSFAGIEKAPHAHNLFLQLFIEVGIFGFLVFLAVMICMMQNGFTLAKKGEDRTVRLIGCGALCGVLAALVQGMTDYIWYNYRVFFVFWIAVGIVAAARRIDFSLREKKRYQSDEYSVDITLL